MFMFAVYNDSYIPSNEHCIRMRFEMSADYVELVDGEKLLTSHESWSAGAWLPLLRLVFRLQRKSGSWTAALQTWPLHRLVEPRAQPPLHASVDAYAIILCSELLTD